jgi:S1-C subfamily serine protease
VAVGGESIKTADDFLSAVESRNPGDTILITVVREGRQLDIPVVLGSEQ